jgi:homocysteine S-methyltransferase
MTTRGAPRFAATSSRICPSRRTQGLGIVLESATWRASRDWGDVLGYSREALDGANCAAIESDVRAESGG